MSDREDDDLIETESDSDEEYENNDNVTEEICGTSPEFCDKIHKLKYKIYENIVLYPTNEDSDEAQDPALLQKYVNVLHIIHNNSIENINNHTKNVVDKTKMNQLGYSDESVELVNDTIQEMNEYVTNNSNLNKMAYISYITNQFKIFPFVQLSSFPEID
jgi:hypothetical protein